MDKLISLNGLKRFKERIFGEIPEVSNPNLLDNPDFKINQRGMNQAFPYQYIADRWYCLDGSVTRNDDGTITLTTTSTQQIPLAQTFETAVNGICTISFNIVNSTGTGGWRFYLNGDEVISTTDGIFSLTKSVNNVSNMYVWGTGEGSLTLGWIKLELGNHATPFVPPHPVTELLKCQRYYQTLGRGTIATIKTNKPGTNGCINLLKPFSVPMRTTPSVTLLGDPKWRDASTYIPKSNEEMRIENVSISSEGIGWLELIGGYDTSSYGANHFVSADADNFIGLSADL